MSLFGGSVKRAPRPEAESRLYDQAQQQRGTAAALQPLVRMRLADIADPSNEIRQQQAIGRADASQAMGRLSDEPITRNTPFDRAMRRGRGLTRVALMGDNAARMQSIRDRATVASFGQSFQRGQAGSLQGLAQSQAMADASRMQVGQIASASRANAFGTLAGAGLAGYDQWRNRGVSGNFALRPQMVNGREGAI